MTIENKTLLIESNNFKLFSSAKNNYIKGKLALLVTESTNKLTFIKITAKCSLYIDIDNVISLDKYKDLTKSLTLLSLVGNITFSLEKGWVASDWIYSGNGDTCSCVLSRSEYYGEIKNEEYIIKIGNIITFGLENDTNDAAFGSKNDTEIIFDFYGEDKKHMGNEAITIHKTFDEPGPAIVKSSKYTLSKTDTAELIWTKRMNGIDTPASEIVTPFFSKSSYKRFPDKENGRCILTHMPPQVHDILFFDDKVMWNTAFCSKTLIRTDTDEGGFTDVTNNLEYSVAFSAQKYVHIRFQGYLYQIDKIIYNTCNCKEINSYVSELSQTLYAFEDSGIRLMRLEWKKNKNFKFLVEGTPMCSDYCIDTTNITCWEYPFQVLGEDYLAIHIFDGKPVYQLIL